MTERRVKAAKAVQDLTEAKDVIQNPSNWMKNKMCNGGDNGAGDCDYDMSDRFCSLDAIRKVRRHGWMEAQDALSAAAPRPKHSSPDPYYVAAFNDEPSTTHADVMALFDLAIEEQCKIVREEAAKDDPNLPDQG